MRFVSSGITATSLAEYKDQIENNLRTVFGPEFVLDDETVIGQLVGAIALALAEVDENAVAVANSFNVNTAVGSQLDALGSILNLSRANTTFSTVVLTGTGINGTSIPEGSQVRGVLSRSVFATDTAVVIGNPTANQYTVTATAIEPGPVEAAAGDITEIVNPIVGWRTVNNVAAAVVGRFGETDIAYRNRFRDAYAHLGRDGIDNIRSSLLNADDDITDVRIVENNTDASVQTTGYPVAVPAHSIYVIVDYAGNDVPAAGSALEQRVARAILESKPAGVGTVRSTNGQEIFLTHGVSNRGTTTIRWDWVQRIPLEIGVRVSLQTGIFPADWETLIKQRIVAWFNGTFRAGGMFDESGLQIGEALDLDRLRTPIYSIPGLSLSSGSPTVERVGGSAIGTPNVNERYTITEDAISPSRSTN